MNSVKRKEKAENILSSNIPCLKGLGTILHHAEYDRNSTGKKVYFCTLIENNFLFFGDPILNSILQTVKEGFA